MPERKSPRRAMPDGVTNNIEQRHEQGLSALTTYEVTGALWHRPAPAARTISKHEHQRTKMKLKLTTKIGSNPIEIETENLKSLFMASGFFADLPAECGSCGSPDLVLRGKKVKGFEFFSVFCRDCKHEMKFGIRKEDGGLFLKESEGWHPPYQGGGGNDYGYSQDQRRHEQPGHHDQRPAPVNQELDDSENIPF